MEIEEDLRLAARVQSTLKPGSVAWDKMSVDAFYHPVRSIGGDFAIVSCDHCEQVNLLVCDVSRHGIGSALVANRIYSETSAHLRAGVPFVEMFGELNRFLIEDIAGKTIVLHNLHLESRGDDRLCGSQLQETLQDAGRYMGETPIVLAGDFNLDTPDGRIATALDRARFQDAFANEHLPTTPNSLFQDGRTIDWIFSRGPVRPTQPQVHRSVSASDHYPLSVTLDFV